MFTQCPECGTIFRVTAAVLRTARGQVRCGVCDATFDALGYLTEDVEVDPVTGAAIATDATRPVAMRPVPAPLVDEAEPIEVSVELGRIDPSRLPAPEFPPFDDPVAAGAPDAGAPTADAPSADAPLFERRAGRNTPSVDEDRALAEIAASIARNAQPLNQRAAAANAAAPDAPVNAATPAGATRPPDPAADLSIELEFLDPADAENIVLSGDAPPIESAELVDAALEFDASTADWDIALVEDRSAPTIPPLRIAAAEAAALGLAPAEPRTDDATPRPDTPVPGVGAATDLPPPPLGVRPEDFDALVAAAAARAAAAVAAAVALPPATAVAGATGAATPVAAPDATSPADLATRGGDPGIDRQDDGLDRHRDPTSPPAVDDTSEFVQFDPSRFQAVAGTRGARPWWVTAMLGLGAVVLATALGAQVVHYRRDDLAQHPVAGPPLRDLYARLGLPIEPTWSLSAYELKQWGAGADSEPGTLRVRASVVNRAGRAQPYPLIRVTLEDRFGGKVARREFTPGEYLPTRETPPQLLASNGRVDADLVLADPGSEAVGFELDVCLPRRGALVCAEDLKLAQAP
ncbi:MAG: DUF3426 domain-containing protein [Pseudomonadota bacterium]